MAERPVGPFHRVSDGLARALLAGPWEIGAMEARARAALVNPGPWVADLARMAHLAYPDRHVSIRELAAFLRTAPPLPARFVTDPDHERPPPALARRPPQPRRWPELPDWPDLAALGLHLGLTQGELAWFADVQARERRAPSERLRHYRYTWIGDRLVEAPKWQLRELQRRILHEVLDLVPPHEAVHGFRVGRSPLTNAAVHAGRRVVLHLDLETFFAGVTAARVHGVFRAAGYPGPVARTLTGLVTNTVPAAVRRRAQAGTDPRTRRLGDRLGVPHLPQGAPTSPAVANLVAYHLDRRLAGLAASAGAAYTRYADDLVFSGGPGLLARAPGFLRLAARIAADEGFRVNPAKTSAVASGARQRVTGLVVNQRPNVDRREFDRLKATLTNAARLGPATQNRAGHADFRAHLAGRVAWVEQVNPARGARLRRSYDRIDWSSELIM